MLSSLLSFFSSSWFLVLRVSPVGNSFPRPLSGAEEAEAIIKAENGDMEARDLLIRHNLRLVAHIVKKFYASREDQDDLISVGTIGLIKAVSSYKSGKNIKLATFAAKCIENEILMYFRSLKKQAGEISLSEPIDTDKDGNTLSLIDIISCEDTMLEDIADAERRSRLLKLTVQALDKREKDIIIMRYGLFGSNVHTQQAVAEHFGISRSYVSRIEKKALEKLKAALGE
ncbi:MAG: RNA polymerase sporulation sigma factor SigK [Clostridia bacterium]|nr:RNA polymerase sporulation sigma factor SigK [Clostridia bacterium]